MISYGRQFHMISCAMRQRMDQTLASMELTSAQGHIMGYLAHCQQPPCARDIEQDFHLSHPTVSGLLARLEKKEFITQQPDPQDKRRKLIYIMPKGKACNEAMDAVIADNDNRLLSGFSQEERCQFQALLARALGNVSQGQFIPKEESHT